MCLCMYMIGFRNGDTGKSGHILSQNWEFPIKLT